MHILFYILYILFYAAATTTTTTTSTPPCDNSHNLKIEERILILNVHIIMLINLFIYTLLVAHGLLALFYFAKRDNLSIVHAYALLRIEFELFIFSCFIF